MNSYDDAYKSLENSEWSPPESLASFLRAEVFEHSRVSGISSVLELGCGMGSVFESPDLSPLGINPTCVDVSETAISRASERKVTGEYLVADVTSPDFFIPTMFDLIVDSHLLHCLTRPSLREAYLANVIKHLKPESGIFAIETMVAHKKMDIPGFDKLTGIVGGDFGRKVFNHLELEQELLKAGLRIEFLIFTSGLNMIPVSGRDEAFITDPQIARALCSFKPA
ncbi:MAG: hypothetical protein CME71_11450 [Halobacteriovorax sp.]|nr:hypothetical protein [Halobacteriovorax sp.]